MNHLPSASGINGGFDREGVILAVIRNCAEIADINHARLRGGRHQKNEGERRIKHRISVNGFVQSCKRKRARLSPRVVLAPQNFSLRKGLKSTKTFLPGSIRKEIALMRVKN